MAIGNYNAGKVLAYPQEMYDINALKSGFFDLTDARQEYMRLKSIARKRLIRLEEAGFSETEIYKANKGNYPAQSKLSDAEFIYKLHDLAKFIASQTSTVTGERQYIRQNVKKLHKHGYTWVEEKNFLKFAEFMDYYRTLNLEKIYSSEEILEILENKDADAGSKELDKLKKDFDKYMKKHEDEDSALSNYAHTRASEMIEKAKKKKRTRKKRK